jgi:FkbM family methyltransferase
MCLIPADKVVSHALSVYGEWAERELALFEVLINPGDCVLDIGAFIGTHALAFSRFVGADGKVIAFEPRKEIYAILLENLNLNACENVSAFQMGLSDERTALSLHELDLQSSNNFGGLSIQETSVDGAEKRYFVDISRIDDIKLEKLNLIKLDVEGMERKVLEGARSAIALHKPLILAECNSAHAGNELLEFCKSAQYEVFGFLAPAFNEENFNGATENVFGSAKEILLVLMPLEDAEKILARLSSFQLPKISSLDDLVLLLLHKPQYAYEILAKTSCAPVLGIEYPSPSNERAHQERERFQSELALQQRENAEIKREWQIAESALNDGKQKIYQLNASLQAISEKLESYRQAEERIVGVLAEREAQIQRLHSQIDEYDDWKQRLISSKSWKLTKPLRWGGRLLRGEQKNLLDPFKRMLSLDKRADTDSANVEKNSNMILARSPIHIRNAVTVIVPVYRGVEMTKRCVLSAMPSIVKVPEARLLAINDGSPDAGMQEMLEHLAAEWPGKIEVLKNEQNLGFVGTVNRAFAHSKVRDVVLLNSDVIVPENWLERLVGEAYSLPNIGTVTPFSNNATICSFPVFLEENPQPFGLDVNIVDSVFRVGTLPCVEAPTGVGFCMYIRRECREEVGFLNQEKFARGYGEENDFCQRAKKSGWLNVITPNLYAYHEGGASFSTEKQKLVERAMAVLDELHPNYHGDVQKFVSSDPLKSMRVGRYIQLLASLPMPKVLHISHSLGGGVTQHVRDLTASLGDSVSHLLLIPTEQPNQICIVLGQGPYADKLIMNLEDSYNELIELLKTIGVSVIHYHHLLGLNADILSLPERLDIPYLLTIHDFYLLNGNPTLTDESGKYPGYYAVECKNPLYPIPSGMTLEQWQQRYRHFISGAARIIFPSSATKEIFEQVYPVPNSVIAPHIEPTLNVRQSPADFQKKPLYRIGVIGAIGREKGADLLESLAQQAKADGMPFEFTLIGYAYRPLSQVKVTGPYRGEELESLIREQQIDIILFPALWPETYSYTLSYALNSGLPIMAPAVGAFPERLSARHNVATFNHLGADEEVMKVLVDFVTALEGDRRPQASYCHVENIDNAFYKNGYIELVSQKITSIPITSLKPYHLKNVNIVHGSLYGTSSWRVKALNLLWKMYMSQSLGWIGKVIPFEVRRAVKRALSRNSIHDLKNGG